MALAHGKPTNPGSLVTRKEIERMLGLSRQRVHQLTASPDFPRPVDDGDDHRHPIWKRAVVKKWAEQRDYPVVAPEPPA